METSRPSRRQTIKWFAAVAAIDLTSLPIAAQDDLAPPPKGYGTDPDLTLAYKPGDVWPLTLTERERTITIALADIILPADDNGPAASEIGIVDFVDEWVSAPYERQVKDRRAVLPGLSWIDEEAQRRFEKGFADLTDAEKTALCDDLVSDSPSSREVARQKKFFQRFTDIASGAYYSTPKGWAAIGYVGNVPSGIFAGPPQEVLDELGLEQTVRD